MAKKLHYFNTNGLGEAIRYMLHYAGHKFEDIRYDIKDWPNNKAVKDSLPYGQLPIYEEGNKTLNQSLAIARYVASISNLLPSDAWEQAKLDADVHSIYDFWAKLIPYVRELDVQKKAVLKKEMLDEFVDFYLSRFEKELKANKGFFSGKLSWADFFLVSIIETADLVLGTTIERNYPYIVALIKVVHELPKVKEYIAGRPRYSMT